MSFLSPWSALIAAAVAVPLLLLLYLLKLRRRMIKIPSTILWRQTTRDLEVNAPFSRLRWSLLLLLQLLALAALLAALAEPLLEVRAASSSRLIIVLDRSASMNARDAPAAAGSKRTRLDEARDAAARIAERVGRSGGPDSVMVLAFGASARVVSPFDTRRDVLLEAIAALEPSDEPADLADAFKLAGAFATRDEDSAESLPEVVLISDGGVGQSPQEGGFTLRCSRLRFVDVGPGTAGRESAVRNVGITSLGVRRDYDDPAQVRVFARLINAGAEPVQTTVRLLVNDKPATERTVEIPAATVGGAPGEAPISLALELPGGAALTLTHNYSDDLTADDTAAIVLPAPAALRVALIHPGEEADPFLRDLIAALEPAVLKEMSPAMYDSLDPQTVDSGAMFDLIVFDRVSEPRMPGVPTLSVGGVPDDVKVLEPQQPGGRRIVSWDRAHPILRHVALDDLVFADFGSLKLPAVATPLAWGPDGPVIALLPAHGARHVIVGFPLIRSNWPTNVSISVFLQNVVDHLTLAGSGGAGIVFQPGEPIAVRALPGRQSIAIVGPAGENRTMVAARPGPGPAPAAGAGAGAIPGPGAGAGAGVVTLPAITHVGLYRLDGVAPPMDQVAVSLLSDMESDIRARPRHELVINAKATAGTGVAGAAPMDLWPWLIAAALGLLIIEWLVYCVRVRR